MDSGAIWIGVAAVQLAAAAYLLAAVSSARFRPAPGHPFRPLPTASIALGWAGVVVAIVAVGDGDFARWVGTGGLMVAAVVLLFVLMRSR